MKNMRTALLFITFCCVTTILLAKEKQPRKYPFRDWIRDSLPPESDTLTDLQRLDMIYTHILAAKNYKKGATLLACVGATLHHRYFPFVFGIKLPLLQESKQDFDAHGKKIPGHLFADKRDKKPDADKLQHFFASSWLAYVFKDAELADMIGIKVEQYEDLIVKGDAFDERDIRANRLGQQFGLQLHKNPFILPGDFFRRWNDEYLKKQAVSK
jgi:hypothetical protein